MQIDRRKRTPTASNRACCTISSLLLLQLLLYHIPPAAARLPGIGEPAPGSSLLRRAPNEAEHVLLTDCRQAERGPFQSYASYWPAKPEPGGKPQDVAVASTITGETRVWQGKETKFLFTTTSTNFTAKIGTAVDGTGFAGIGRNDYRDFVCWDRFYKDMFKYDGWTCSMVYDCSHEETPAANGTFEVLFDAAVQGQTQQQPTPSETSGANATQSTSSTTSSGNVVESGAGSGTPASNSRGLSTGVLIGIVAGGVAGLAITVGAIVFFWMSGRKTKTAAAAAKKKKKAAVTADNPPSYSGGDMWSPPPPGAAVPGTPGWMYAGHDKKVWPLSPTTREASGLMPRSGHHELDGLWHGVEAVGDKGTYPELDGRQLRAELDRARSSMVSSSAASGLPLSSPCSAVLSPVTPRSPHWRPS